MTSPPLYEFHRHPELDDPVLVMQLEGWIDAGLGAAAAMATLLAHVETEVVATFDSEAFLDLRARRPTMTIEDGVNAGLAWPRIELRAGHDRAGNPLLVLAGPEPDHRWRAFADAAGALASELGARLAVGLGAFPAPVPHTRPSKLAATATNAELARLVGFVPGRLEVPAGIQAALELRFAEVGIPAVTLWARVPHYVSAMPYPAASVELLDGLSRVSGVQAYTGELRRAAQEATARIDALVAENAEHEAMVRQLEAQVDSEESGQDLGPELPSGDELAAEIQRYLREQG
jgi:hypothetical protein